MNKEKEKRVRISLSLLPSHARLSDTVVYLDAALVVSAERAGLGSIWAPSPQVNIFWEERLEG